MNENPDKNLEFRVTKDRLDNKTMPALTLENDMFEMTVRYFIEDMDQTNNTIPFSALMFTCKPHDPYFMPDITKTNEPPFFFMDFSNTNSLIFPSDVDKCVNIMYNVATSIHHLKDIIARYFNIIYGDKEDK